MPATTKTVRLASANSNAARILLIAPEERRHSEPSEESLFACSITAQTSARAPLSC